MWQRGPVTREVVRWIEWIKWTQDNRTRSHIQDFNMARVASSFQGDSSIDIAWWFLLATRWKTQLATTQDIVCRSKDPIVVGLAQHLEYVARNGYLAEELSLGILTTGFYAWRHCFSASCKCCFRLLLACKMMVWSWYDAESIVGLKKPFDSRLINWLSCLKFDRRATTIL